MLQEPLLPCHGGQTTDRPDASSSFLGFLRVAQVATPVAALRHWWQVTTDKEFRRSKISRRPLQKVVIPMMGLFFLSFDSFAAVAGFGEKWWVLPDMMLVGTACAWGLSSIGGPESFFADVFFGSIIGAMAVTFCLGPNPAGPCDPLPVIVFPGHMMTSCLLGFHSLMIGWLWALSVVCCFLAESVSWELPFTTSVVACGCFLFEFSVAALYRQGQTLLHCNQKLLDCATDGFGVVDCETGLLVETSTKMVQTLGGLCSTGQRLDSFIDQRDHVALTASFFGDGQWQAASPVLVTCKISETLRCDVRMVPYHLHGSQMGFCLQRVGEVRECARSDMMFEAGPALEGVGEAAAAAGAGTPAAHAEVVDVDDSISQVMVPSSVAAASCGSAKPPLPLQRASNASSRASGTLSLSSWSVSQSGEGSSFSTGFNRCKKCQKKKVETRTYGVQVDIKQKPPAPLSASTVPEPVQLQAGLKASRRRRLARACASIVIEDRPRLKCFAATPKASRLNALMQIAQSCNVGGTSCCERHLAWMSLQVLVSDELVQPCSRFPLASDWQCPSCLSLHGFDVGCDKEEELLTDQICGICQEVVEPRGPAAEPSSLQGDPLLLVKDSPDASCSSSEAGCQETGPDLQWDSR